MRAPTALLATALLAVLCAAPTAGAGDLSPEEQRWLKDAIEGLAANSPRVRRGAEEAVARLGVDAVPAIAEALPSVKGEAARKGLKRALEAMGRADVLAAVERLRQAAPRASAKRYEDLAALLGATPGGTGGEPGAVPLVPGRLEDPALAPLAATRWLRGRLPAEWTQAAHVVRETPEGLRVDSDGDGTAETLVPSGEARVVEAGAADGKALLLVFARAGAWWACPAACLRAGTGARAVELLDGDLDGAHDGPADFVRAADGAFGPRDEARRVWLEDGVATYAVAGEGASRRLTLTPEPDPAGADDAALSGLRALHRWRRSLGLPPARLDPRRSDACRKHAAYLRQNAGTPEVAGLDAHREVAGKPGYTPEGAEAGGAGLISGAGEAGAAVGSLAVTMLHGAGLLGTPSSGFGIGTASGRGGATVVWGEDATVGEGGAPIVVPAPGQAHVPLRARPEEPPPSSPADWYASPRGFPVTVVHRGLGLTNVDVRLHRADGMTPVEGVLWNDESPVRGGYARGVAFFMPSAPLERGASYVAVATGRREGGERRWAWTFRTD